MHNKQVNNWKFLLFFLVILVLVAAVLYGKNNSSFRLIPLTTETPVSTEKTFRGTIKTGAQLGEVKQHCSEGLYLTADEGSYLINQTQMLHLRIPHKRNEESTMLSDQQYIGKKVEVIGKYPVQENFCEALICDCEDYILVNSINVVSLE